jgi:cation diffusion facilitator CzcD-associated flavoprotein CzcO
MLCLLETVRRSSRIQYFPQAANCPEECMTSVLDAVVIGAGSAGLGVSYFLKQHDCEHRVLERGRIGESWRSSRWDSFRLNSTNIRTQLP